MAAISFHKTTMFFAFSIAIAASCFLAAAQASKPYYDSDGDKILLRDISVLTLYHGRSTTARRSSPIPQIKCIGGTAGCTSFVPQVIQCYNRGTDGYDVQWECKTDMDNAYRFGSVEVSCEGYDYPDDPYVLKGSCGLEYTLDFTKEGYERQQRGGGHQYYGGKSEKSAFSSLKMKGSSWWGDMLLILVVAAIVYAIYRTCIGGAGLGAGPDPDEFGAPRRPPPSYGSYSSHPPPPGFRSDYTSGDSCSGTAPPPPYSSYSGYGTRPSTGTGGGGFWTGAATGGILGYMMGGRTNTQYAPRNSWGSGWGSGWGSSWGNAGSAWEPGWSSGLGSRSQSSWSTPSTGGGSTGTRTASGFGGTRRR